MPSTIDKGAWAELLVAADLLGRGFIVYRSVTAIGPFDLAAYKNHRFLRIEVKTRSKNARGKVRHPTHTDLLACVYPDCSIRYRVIDSRKSGLSHSQAWQDITREGGAVSSLPTYNQQVTRNFETIEGRV